jgi:hypothetical protein
VQRRAGRDGERRGARELGAYVVRRQSKTAEGAVLGSAQRRDRTGHPPSRSGGGAQRVGFGKPFGRRRLLPRLGRRENGQRHALRVGQDEAFFLDEVLRDGERHLGRPWGAVREPSGRRDRRRVDRAEEPGERMKGAVEQQLQVGQLGRARRESRQIV